MSLPLCKLPCAVYSAVQFTAYHSYPILGVHLDSSSFTAADTQERFLSTVYHFNFLCLLSCNAA
jgi:hypothetical protein